MNNEEYTVTPQDKEIVNDYATRKITIDFLKYFKSRTYKFACVDFETATPSRMACQVGITVIRQGQIEPTMTYFIQPPNNEYDENTSRFHHVTPEMTADAPTFAELWESELKYIFDEGTIFVAHNSSFDLDTMRKNIAFYNIKAPRYENVICTYDITGLSLKEACRTFNISLPNHHDAGCDSRACANILYKFLSDPGARLQAETLKLNKIKDPEQRKNRRAKAVYDSVRDLIKKCEEFDVEPGDYSDSSIRDRLFASTDVDSLKAVVEGKYCLITGELPDLLRPDFLAFLAENGAKLKNNISATVDVLIIGHRAGASKLSKLESANRIRSNRGLSNIDTVRFDRLKEIIRLWE